VGPLDVSCREDEMEPRKIIIGAGNQRWPGWQPTQQEDLDLLRRRTWVSRFSPGAIDALLCEHVWEHLTEAEGRAAAALCYEFLKPGGYLRCAVPDGNFPDEEYQRTAQVGGPGPADHPAASHKIVYEYRRLSDVFQTAGFEVDLLEYCDDRGRFHYHQWNSADGPIYRSLLSDHRNQEVTIRFVSLILDARKPVVSGD